MSKFLQRSVVAAVCELQGKNTGNEAMDKFVRNFDAIFKVYQQNNPNDHRKKEIVLKTSILSFDFKLTVIRKSAVKVSKKAYLQHYLICLHTVI